MANLQNGVALAIDPETLRPLVEAAVRQTVQILDAEREECASKIAYSEEEAARLLSVRSHQLRDERLRGRIAASIIIGRRVRYLRSDLIAYMHGRRMAGVAKAA